MFCVSCGREVGDAPLVDGLCETCFLDENVLSRAPDVVDLEVCAHCGARRRGEEAWVDEDLPMEAAARAAVGEAVEVDHRVEDPRVFVDIATEDAHGRNFRAEAVVEGEVGGLEFRETHAVRARVKRATCLRCSRYFGGYFESIVQLRREGRRNLTEEELREARSIASRVVTRIMAQGDRNAYVLQDELHHGGLDITMGTIQSGRAVARALAEKLGGRVGESPQLVGRREGREVYRVTFSVKVPAYRVGDLVAHDDTVYVVQSLGSKRVRLKRLPDREAVSLERDTLESATVIPREEARDAVVVSAGGDELQVLDPWTYSTVTVRAPPGVGEAGGAVSVVKHDDELVVVPP